MSNKDCSRLVALLGCLALAGCGGGGSGPASPSGTASSAPTSAAKPNIVFIVTDDLDSGSMAYLPRLKAALADQGATFTYNYSTNPICCASRASMLTGQYPHNHNIWNNGRSISCFEVFRDQGSEASTVATWLKAAGYRTALVGKYLNRYPGLLPTAQDTYIPQGWDSWFSVFNKDLNSDSYYDYSVNENGKIVSYGERDADYLTDVLADKAVDFIQKSSASGAPPFFLWIATSAPHTPAPPPSRYVHATNAPAPRTPSFNEDDIGDKPSWYRRNLPPLTSSDIHDIDDLFQRRVDTMQAVEDLVDRLVRALQTAGQLDRTYIVFTSDNGFMLGQHRFPSGKDAPYEESIKVPLVVRGPGVPAGVVREHFASGADLAPTFAEWARASAPASVDGRSLVPLLGASPPGLDDWRKDVFVEHEGDGVIDPLPSWGLIRTRAWKYVDYPALSEREYYDLVNDPYELENQGRNMDATRRAQALARLSEMQSCKGAGCRTQPSF